MKPGICAGLVLWVGIWALPLGAEEISPRMVLVIDDLGPNLSQGQAVIELPGPLTYAVLPFTPHAERLAVLAAEHGKEIILHAPMANMANLHWPWGALSTLIGAGV